MPTLFLEERRPVADAFHSSLRPLRELQRDSIRWALDRHEGNRTATATAFEIGRNTLLRKLRRDSHPGAIEG